MTLAGKAAVLRGRISTDEDLSDFMNFFFANFFDDPSFMGMGRTYAASRLRATLELIGQQFFAKPDVSVTRISLFEVPELGFIHGTCQMEGGLAMVVYVPEVETGVCAIRTGVGHESLFARFKPVNLEAIPVKTAMLQ